MKMKMRPRYYCDHCGKANGSAYAMRRHEPACTMNPGRTCRMCLKLYGRGGRLSEGKAAFLDPALSGDWKARMSALREAVEDCPCCILAVLRQTGTTKGPRLGEAWPEGSWWKSALTGSRELLGFNFKAELAEAMKEHDFHNTRAS